VLCLAQEIEKSNSFAVLSGIDSMKIGRVHITAGAKPATADHLTRTVACATIGICSENEQI